MLSRKLVMTYMAAICLLAGFNIYADAIYDNLPAVSSTEDVPPGKNLILATNLMDITTNGSIPQPGSFLASSFSTGSGVQLLTDVKLLVESVSPYAGSFTVSLFSDSNTAPKNLVSILATVQVNQISASYNVLDLAVNNYDLSSNTRYWIELTSTDASVKWSWAYLSTNDVGVAAEYFWDNGAFGVNSTSLYPFQMQITTVPLPASFSLMGSVLAIFALWRRKFMLVRFNHKC